MGEIMRRVAQHGDFSALRSFVPSLLSSSFFQVFSPDFYSVCAFLSRARFCSAVVILVRKRLRRRRGDADVCVSIRSLCAAGICAFLLAIRFRGKLSCSTRQYVRWMRWRGEFPWEG